ncbi:hypothetical protein COO60DRAFT_705891 [Scenedesmus sp. NREL 46B-D3]|nr:hypothetical protein COO60DRAFT_705891 [Scenedesmus sp. NREL 46B-D3]
MLCGFLLHLQGAAEPAVASCSGSSPTKPWTDACVVHSNLQIIPGAAHWLLLPKLAATAVSCTVCYCTKVCALILVANITICLLPSLTCTRIQVCLQAAVHLLLSVVHMQHARPAHRLTWCTHSSAPCHQLPCRSTHNLQSPHRRTSSCSDSSGARSLSSNQARGSCSSRAAS